MEHIQALTDKLHAREDLSLACRCATLLAPRGPAPPAAHMMLPP